MQMSWPVTHILQTAETTTEPTHVLRTLPGMHYSPPCCWVPFFSPVPLTDSVVLRGATEGKCVKNTTDL